MQIESLHLSHFRNHSDTRISFGPGINLITGKNGTGKTNLIDGIHYICMSRSFSTASDSYVVEKGERSFSVKAQVSGSIRSSFKVSCTWTRGEGKAFTVNNSPLPRLADLIGMVPVVVLSPEDKRITNEGPAERRTFLDSMISQVSRKYLADLMDFRKIMRQRNRLLSIPGIRPDLLDIQLEPWDRQLADTGARIIKKRIDVLDAFSTFLESSYHRISGIGLKPSFDYKTISDFEGDETTEDISAQYLKLLHENRERESERQLTLTGPHRDDLVFFLDGMELRKFGSQGQHRLFALALKLAELEYFNDVLDDQPVFLLDDVFGDLDASKIKVLSEMLIAHNGQCFITAANEAPFRGLIPADGNINRHFHVEKGPEIFERNPA